MLSINHVIKEEDFDVKILRYNFNSKTEETGWIVEENGIQITKKYLTAKNAVSSLDNDSCNNTEKSWSNSHEEMHEDSSKNHFLDKHERNQVKKWLAPYVVKRENVICDLGASTGYMLEDLMAISKGNALFAGDLFESGLIKSQKRNPSILHIQLDACFLPFQNQSFDIAISLNVLEHIEEDQKAIAEMYRILKLEGIACIVVPFGDKQYDYYDEVMFHKRRYGKFELANKLEKQGFKILKENYLAFTGWIPFAMKKKLNRMRHGKDSFDEKNESGTKRYSKYFRF